MDDEATTETLFVEGHTVVTAETVERPPSERPAHDSINGIADWMIGPARRITSGAAAIDEFSWRLYAAGLPLLRVSLHVGRCIRNISALPSSGGETPGGGADHAQA